MVVKEKLMLIIFTCCICITTVSEANVIESAKIITFTDCSVYSTVNGGVDFVLGIAGMHLDDETPVGKVIVMQNRTTSNGYEISARDSTCELELGNKYRCPAPELVWIPKMRNKSIEVFPCTAGKFAGDLYTCFNMTLNGTVVNYYPGNMMPTLEYFKLPKFQKVSVIGRRRLGFTGEFLSLWKPPRKGCTLGIKPYQYFKPYNITWGDLQCIVNWEESNDTFIECSTKKSSASDNINVQLGRHVVFNHVLGQEKDDEASTLQTLLPLIIVLPIVVFISVCATLIFCLFRRFQSRRFKHTTPFVVSMMPTPNVAVRLEELPPDLLDQVKPLLLEESSISLGGALGSGFSGEVCRAILTINETSILVAVKFIKNINSTDDLRQILREAILMCEFEHPNVLECHGIYFSRDHRLAIVVPFMEESDLRHYVINNKEEIGFRDIVELALQVAQGMLYLSNQNYVHRDLAARNCLINTAHVVKVSDFGMSRQVYDEEDYYQVEDLGGRPLPVRWMAPECLNSGKFTIKTDVWAFGIFLWELCTKGGFPYADLESYEVVEGVKNGHVLAKASEIHESLYEVMLMCWAFDPSRRPSFSDLVRILSDLRDQAPSADSANYVLPTRDDDYLLPDTETTASHADLQHPTPNDNAGGMDNAAFSITEPRSNDNKDGNDQYRYQGHQHSNGGVKMLGVA